MANFEKLLLLTEDERDQLRQKRIKEFNPQIRTMAFLEEEMEKLLNDTSPLDADSKLKLFQAAQNRYELLQQTLQPQTVPTLAGVVPPPKAAATTTTTTAVATGTTAAAGAAAAPSAVASRITKINEFLKGHEDVIRSDPALKLALGGVSTADDFHNVIKFLAAQKHIKAPSALPELLDALHSIAFPSALIANKQALTKYQKLQTGEGRIVKIINTSPTKLVHKRTLKSFIKPPGKKPKILRVY